MLQKTKNYLHLHIGVIWFLEIKCERVGLTSNNNLFILFHDLQRMLLRNKTRVSPAVLSSNPDHSSWQLMDI